MSLLVFCISKPMRRALIHTAIAKITSFVGNGAVCTDAEKKRADYPGTTIRTNHRDTRRAGHLVDYDRVLCGLSTHFTSTYSTTSRGDFLFHVVRQIVCFCAWPQHTFLGSPVSVCVWRFLVAYKTLIIPRECHMRAHRAHRQQRAIMLDRKDTLSFCDCFTERRSSRHGVGALIGGGFVDLDTLQHKNQSTRSL